MKREIQDGTFHSVTGGLAASEGFTESDSSMSHFHAKNDHSLLESTFLIFHSIETARGLSYMGVGVGVGVGVLNFII